jgi:hypothetical protein
MCVQNYWVFGLFPSFGVLENRKHQTMGKVQKPSNSECYTQSSEPFRTKYMHDYSIVDRLLVYNYWYAKT